MAQADASGDPFEALGDANRREILRLLSGGDKPVQEIAAAMPISRPAVSRHLRLLREAGMVTEQAQGTRRIYHLQARGMHAIQAYLENIWGEAAARFRLLAENTDLGNTGLGNPDLGNPDLGNPDLENTDLENTDLENTEKDTGS
jgi:DNA-binding transcriptional ArsR family regulator